MILQPQQYFAICRQIPDPADLTVYYIQAEIREASTDTLLETVNLDSKGNGRWRKNWQVPADPSSQGRYITITTRVYDDAAYSVLDQNYGTEEREYLIQRINRHPVGGGGEIMTPKQFRTLLKEELSAMEKSEGNGESLESVDFSPILSTLGTAHKPITEGLKALQAREFPKVDLTPLHSAIAALEAKFEARMTEEDGREEPDYKQEMANIVTSLRDFEDTLSSREQKYFDSVDRMEGLASRMERDYKQWSEDLTTKLQSIVETIARKDGREANVAKTLTTLLASMGPEEQNEPDKSEKQKQDAYRSRASALA